MQRIQTDSRESQTKGLQFHLPVSVASSQIAQTLCESNRCHPDIAASRSAGRKRISQNRMQVGFFRSWKSNARLFLPCIPATSGGGVNVGACDACRTTKSGSRRYKTKKKKKKGPLPPPPTPPPPHTTETQPPPPPPQFYLHCSQPPSRHTPTPQGPDSD